MTNARKIEVLLLTKKTIESRVYTALNICAAFYGNLSASERMGIDKIEIIEYLGDIFLKHKPKNKRINDYWFPRTIKWNLKRIEILDKMIAELKTSEQ